MNVLIRSAFSDSELEREIDKAVQKAESHGFYLTDVKYSTCYDESEKAVLRSALLIFEEYDEEDAE